VEKIGEEWRDANFVMYMNKSSCNANMLSMQTMAELDCSFGEAVFVKKMIDEKMLCTRIKIRFFTPKPIFFTTKLPHLGGVLD
jgi:23S rRNA A1618 N6-methylase RlmF